jgi:hypothetical protein
MMSIYEFGFLAAIAGTVFASVRPGWFTPWYEFLLKVETWGRFGKWISKPFGLCHLCVSGMLALMAHFYASGWDHSIQGITFHILTSCVAILAASGLNKFWEWSKN